MSIHNELTNVLIDAILRNDTVPSRSLADSYKAKRFNRVARALLSRNVFVPVIISTASQSARDIAVGYSAPLESAALLWGFTWTNADNIQASNEARTLKMAVEGHELVDNVPAMMATIAADNFLTAFSQSVSGYGMSPLTTPFIVPAGARIAIELAYNPAATEGFRVDIYNSILLMFIVVKTCLDDDDREILEQCRRWIETHEYQVPVMLNSVTPPTDSNLNVIWPSRDLPGLDPEINGFPGAETTSQTRPVSAPVLVRSVATNLQASRLTIQDSRGHQFSPTGMFLARHLSTGGAAAAVFSPHFRLAMPHVLAPGAELRAEHLDGTGASTISFDGGSILDPPNILPSWLVYGCITP